LALGVDLSTDKARVGRSTAAGGIGAAGLATALILALGSAPAAARTKYTIARKDHKESERVSREPFGDMPKGQVQIFISINQQKLHVYSDGVPVAVTSVATGVPHLPTPLGVFSVIQKQVIHRSNIYSNAPMPFMQRITWSGVAMHEGENIGHPASHGCIRMPREFAMRLYGVTKLGVRVIIARSELKPTDFADPHLFVRKDKPPAPAPAAAAPAPAEAVKTAQSLDSSKTIDGAADPPAAAAPANTVPVPPDKPVIIVRNAQAKNTPIAIFVSRKEKKIYVRQNFEPLFDAAVTIAHPEEPLGTHVFTAMAFLGSDRTALRWNVVSLPGEAQQKPVRHADDEDRYQRHSGRRRDVASVRPSGETPPPQTPTEALARIDIPQDVIDHISEMMVPGSSLIVSDHGLGDETGEGTDFIVVTAEHPVM
jgi:hypothetical protein